MDIIEHDLSQHKVVITQENDMALLKCVYCSWSKQANLASPTKMHPHRDPLAFATAMAERHILSNNVWPWDKDGKPKKIIRNNDGSTTEPMTDWPNDGESNK
jgi:hypothetical protein